MNEKKKISREQQQSIKNLSRKSVDYFFIFILFIAICSFLISFTNEDFFKEYNSSRDLFYENLSKELAPKRTAEEYISTLLDDLPASSKKYYLDEVQRNIGQLDSNSITFEAQEKLARERLLIWLVEDKYKGLSFLQSLSLKIVDHFDYLLGALGLFLALSIFLKQSIYGEESLRQLENIFNKAMFKQDRGAIKKLVSKWGIDPETNFILFYFPHSIIPGFWVDHTYFLETSALLENNKSNTQFIFLGPAPEDKIVNELSDIIAKAHFDNRTKKYKHFSLKNSTFHSILKETIPPINISELSESIKNLYIEQFEMLKKLNKRKCNVKYYCIDPDKNKFPSYSLVIRGTETNTDHHLEMILVDSHKIAETSGATPLIQHLHKSNKNHDKYIFNDHSLYNIVNDIPSTYIVGHSGFINLLSQTLIETVVNPNDNLREFLNCKKTI